MLKLFFNLVYTLTCVSDKARRQRESESRTAYFSLALSSMAYAVFAVGFAAVGAYLFKWISDADNIVIWILFGALAVAVILGTLAMLFHSLVRMIFQFTVNCNVFSWIALVVFIAAIAGSGVMVWLFLG